MVISHYDADCHDILCSGCSAQSETCVVYLHLLIVILINQNYLKSTQTSPKLAYIPEIDLCKMQIGPKILNTKNEYL